MPVGSAKSCCGICALFLTVGVERHGLTHCASTIITVTGNWYTSILRANHCLQRRIRLFLTRSENALRARSKRKEEKERAEQRRIAAYSQTTTEVESDGDEFDFADVDDPAFWREFDAIQNNECPEI